MERVAGSSQLKRAVRLQELLFYISKRSLKEGCDRVYEQEIGCQVFGRPESYDTAYDNIVRTNISDLRKRIEQYFNSEGRHEKLIMELPRGSYVPVFKVREQEPVTEAVPPAANEADSPQPAAPSPQAPAAVSNPNRFFPARTAIEILILAVAIGSALFFWGRYRSLHHAVYAWQDEPAVSDFWSRILTTNPDTDIVLSDASIGLTQTLSNRQISLKDYLSRSYLGQLQTDGISADKLTAMNRILAWNLGSPEEYVLARRISALDPLDQHIHVYDARFYMADLMRLDNVILIGARESNPWAEVFDDRLNFPLQFGNGSITVGNRSPVPGEPKVYAQTDSVHYCDVAFLPNPEHNGVVLLIEGTNAEATEAAGDFLLSEEQLANFKKALHAKTFPYFEALLKVSSVQGTPFTATVAAFRTYSNLH